MSCALALILTLAITGELAASARVHSPVFWKTVESSAVPVILVASGKSPKLLRPTFNKVARPVARQTNTGRRVGVSRTISRPVVAKGLPAGRIGGVSLPRGNQRVSVSPTAARKFATAIKPTINKIAKSRSLTLQQIRGKSISSKGILTKSATAIALPKMLVSPSKANSGFEKPPYDPKKPIRDSVANGKATYVRVYAEGFNKPNGNWMMKADDIKGLSAQQIKDKFDLPRMPTHIVDVRPPYGTSLRTGTVNKGNFGGSGGGKQIQALKEIPVEFYSNSRKLLYN